MKLTINQAPCMVLGLRDRALLIYHVHTYRIFSIKRRTPNKRRVQINAGSRGLILK